MQLAPDARKIRHTQKEDYSHRREEIERRTVLTDVVIVTVLPVHN